jgi:hypothetical protein
MCHIPFGNGRPGYKSPKLSELYEFTMNLVPVPTDLHNALYDVQILVEILKNSVGLKNMLGLPTNTTTKVNGAKKARTTLTI